MVGMMHGVRGAVTKTLALRGRTIADMSRSDR